MENNIINAGSFNERRPKKKKEFTTEQINIKIDRETKLAWHSLRLFCIKNALWLIPLSLFLTIAGIIDFIAIFCIWKNPVIIFNQFKTLIGWVVAYILGLYTDEIRREITKH